MRQVAHQVQIKRQLLGAQALKQRQHKLARLGGEEVVGVFNTAFDATQLAQLAQLQTLQQRARFFGRDFGKYGHGSEHKKRKAYT